MKKYLFIVTTAVYIGSMFFAHAFLSPAFAQSLENPLAGNVTDIRLVIGIILKGALGLTGTIALAVFVYGGYQWLLARGEPGEVKKGLDTMIWAALGLAVIFGSYAILDRVFKIIQ